MLRRVGVVTAMVVLAALPGSAEGLWTKVNDSNPLEYISKHNQSSW
jgi:hypothetical protein